MYWTKNRQTISNVLVFFKVAHSFAVTRMPTCTILDESSMYPILVIDTIYDWTVNETRGEFFSVHM